MNPKEIARLITEDPDVLSGEKCPECGADAYVGLWDIECPTQGCKNYSEKQAVESPANVLATDLIRILPTIERNEFQSETWIASKNLINTPILGEYLNKKRLVVVVENKEWYKNWNLGTPHLRARINWKGQYRINVRGWKQLYGPRPKYVAPLFSGDIPDIAYEVAKSMVELFGE
jgi:hypothetical protein